jgi:hypothetical protein
MPSGFALLMKIKYKRFRRWLSSDDFWDFVKTGVALLVIFIMVASIFVVML